MNDDANIEKEIIHSLDLLGETVSDEFESGGNPIQTAEEAISEIESLLDEI